MIQLLFFDVSYSLGLRVACRKTSLAPPTFEGELQAVILQKIGVFVLVGELWFAMLSLWAEIEAIVAK